MSWFRRFRKTSSGRASGSTANRVRPTLELLESRLVPYNLSGDAWPHPQLITLSFMPDGTILGSNGQGYITSNLFSAWNAHFGSVSAWQNQILRAAQTWAQQTDVNFTVVPDNGAAEGAGNYQQGDPGMGDIRIGGYNFGSSTLAQAFMPPPANNYSVAGDIQFNTGQGFNVGTTYDLYTVALHEIGHVLGLYHSGVYSAAMYGAYTGTKSALTSDDVAGIQKIYSNGGARAADAYDAGSAPNTSFAAAANLTPQINSNTLTAVVTGLSLDTTSDADYYTFTAPSGTSKTLTVTAQSQGLSLLAPKLWVYAADQITVLGFANGTGKYGTTQSVTVSNVTAGERFYVKVAGADTSAFGTGAYALTLNLGTGASPAVPLPNTQTLNGNPLSGGGGQANQVEQEFRVNTTTADVQQTSYQSPHAVATDANGNFVVTWASDNQDGSGWGVYAQRYDAQGDPVGGEFRVNTTTAGDQMYSDVAMDATGAFVITWSSDNQDGSGWGVYAQRYDAQGDPLGGEFRVNTTTAGDQMYSDVAMDANGNFVVTWSSNPQDGSGWGVYAQRYGAAGNRLGGEFRVSPAVTGSSGISLLGLLQLNTTTTVNQEYSSVAMDAAGAFVVTWSSYGQDGNFWEVYAQRYDANGNPLGGEFHANTSPTGNSGINLLGLTQVNTSPTVDRIYPRVAMDGGGNFLVTWSSDNQDGSGWGVYAQWWSPAGVAQGNEFRVNTTTAGDQEYSTVAMDANGNFLVTWSSNGQDGSGWSVYAQQYAAGGVPVGNEFRVNTTTTGDQLDTAVALDGDGDAVVAWSGNGPGDTSGVFAQRYTTGANTLNAGLPMVAGDAFDPNGDGDASPGGAGAAGDPTAGGESPAETVRGGDPGGTLGQGHHPGGHHRPAHPKRGAGDQPALLLRQWFARMSSYLTELLGHGM
jgi:hypothetical protein